GLATLEALGQPGVYDELDRKGARLADGLKWAADDARVPAYFTRVGSMACMFFTDAEVKDWASASGSDTERYGRYFRAVLEAGFTIAPSQFEATFVSTAHSDADIDAYVEAAGAAMKTL
ncbi:MAG: aspartate aminotransferase family protein, partial [Coriobacteriia bacterium]|nr:aspartate aminotransferase family protein [Coriobacteriia bacterium]